MVYFGCQRWLGTSTDGLYMAVPRLLIFNASVLSNAYSVLTQNPFFSRDVL